MNAVGTVKFLSKSTSTNFIPGHSFYERYDPILRRRLTVGGDRRTKMDERDKLTRSIANKAR